MDNGYYDPAEEARFLGLKINLLKLKKLKSFLIEQVVYLNENMNRIEKRCALTYEIVKYLWNKYNKIETECWHSKNVENILKQQTARKLVCPEKFNQLYQNNIPLEDMEQELEVTKEYIFHYLNYCKTIKLVEENQRYQNNFNKSLLTLTL